MAPSVQNPATSDALDRWRHLMTLAALVKALAPWEFMDETQNFAVQLPPPHEVGLVSVMGASGEHFAVALYLGRRAIFDFWALLADENGTEPEVVLEIDQLQLSWEDRALLDHRDRQLLAALGVKPRGAHAWPMLRRYRAGYIPWFVHDDEIDLMITALEHLLIMAPRFQTAGAPLTPPPGQRYLLRYPASPTLQPADWNERVEGLRCDDWKISLVVDAERMRRVAALPTMEIDVELDVFAAPMMKIDGIEDGVGQPYYPYMLLAADRVQGLIMGFQLVTALDGLDHMWSQVPAALADLLVQIACRPARIFVHRALLSKVLASFCDNVEIELRLVRNLKAVAAARRALAEFAAR